MSIGFISVTQVGFVELRRGVWGQKERKSRGEKSVTKLLEVGQVESHSQKQEINIYATNSIYRDSHTSVLFTCYYFLIKLGLLLRNFCIPFTNLINVGFQNQKGSLYTYPLMDWDLTQMNTIKGLILL